MILRRATGQDSETLLRWRNDPLTRAMSLRQETVGEADHVGWLEARLSDPRCELWIGVIGGAPVGQVRLDLVTDDVAEVSISVDPQRRGEGLGLALLLAAIERSGLDAARLRATVRHGNPASRALFLRAGFEELRSDEEVLVLEREVAGT